jgi:predicted nucleotidyltransferase
VAACELGRWAGKRQQAQLAIKHAEHTITRPSSATPDWKQPMSNDRINQFLDEFTKWAATQGDIRAVALVGSYASNAATDTSDVDLVVVVRQPAAYLRDAAWLHRFGSIDRHQLEYYGNVTSIRVWYSDGREVEYGMTDESWATVPLDEGTQRVISDGMHILFEREPLLSRHHPPTLGPPNTSFQPIAPRALRLNSTVRRLDTTRMCLLYLLHAVRAHR